MVTQRDIAQRCGIHQTTVSLALRGDPRISPETTEHILKIAREMGYDPSAHAPARRMAAHRHGHEVRNHVIAVAMPPQFIHMHYYAALFQGIVDVLEPEGYAVVLASLRGDSPLPTIFNRGDVDGLLHCHDAKHFVPLEATLRATPGFGDRPMVSLMWPSDTHCAVRIDDHGGAYQAARHLLELGHRHLAQFFGHSDDSDLRVQNARQEGARQAVRDFGLDPAEHLLLFDIPGRWISPLWRPVAGAPAERPIVGDPLVQFLRDHPQTTGFLAINDASAIQAWFSLNAAGLRVPDDYSIVGFDDVDPMYDDFGHNQLTSVRLPLVEIGRRAARLMIDLVTGKADDLAHQVLETQLMARGSTAAPRNLP
jgi:DNA-binding LacI/PurR family transcriptional regulator